MKLSITSWSFTACSLQEAWGIARAIGVNHMDLGLLHTPALDRASVISDPEGAAASVRNLGVRVSNLYWLFGDSLEERTLSDPSSRAGNATDFRAVLAFARALDCPTIFVLPGVYLPGRSIEDLTAASVDSLNELTAMAGEAGIVLTIEPHVGGLLTSPAATLEFIERVPGLKLTLDYSHFACMGFTQHEIDPLARHAAHVHLRQARPGCLQAKWGQGTLDFAGMIATLKSVGYASFLSLEYVHQDYMNTIYDDVLTETIRMRDHVAGCLVS